MENVYIIGCGGLGREIAAMLLRSTRWAVPGFFDDGVAAGDLVMGLPVLGNVEALISADIEHQVVFGMANPAVKKRLWDKLSGYTHIRFPALISEEATLLSPDHIQINPGTVIMPGAIISPDVKIGFGGLIHIRCVVSHDTVVGEFCSLLQGVIVPSGGHIPAESILPAGSVWRQ